MTDESVYNARNSVRPIFDRLWVRDVGFWYDRGMVLLSTLHDPTGAMVNFLRLHLGALRQLYSAYVVVATPATSAETLTIYRDFDCEVWATGSAEIGTSRRAAVKLALEMDANWFHYCDADRILHWQMSYPDELRNVVRHVIPAADYSAIGRNPRAYATHPLVQREAEYICNRVFALLYNQPDGVLDVCAGSCGFSRRAGELIRQYSCEPTNATDAEWPMLIGNCDNFSVQFVETDGLEFETPTFFGAASGQKAHNADNWAARIRLAIDSFEAAARLRSHPL
jgi:hypothetical protein